MNTELEKSREAEQAADSDKQFGEYLQFLTACGIELANRASSAKFDFYQPNQKHKEFFEAGAQYAERCFTACNQGGKSTAGAFEDVCHLTGNYPGWWKGRRFTEPTIGAVIGNTARQMRAAIQQILLGPPGQWGTGMVPSELLAEPPKTVHGVSGAADYFKVKHSSGGISTCYMVTSEQGWRAIQGMKLHFIHPDEEPLKSVGMEIYQEMVPRLIINNGIFYMTATPQQGMTDLMGLFFLEDEDDGDTSELGLLRREGAKYRKLIRMTVDDADHMTDEQKIRFKTLCVPSMRRSRLEGYPEMGEGRVWDFPETVIFCDPFDVKREGWKFIRGIDSGFVNSYTAAVDAAICPDTKCIYVYNCLKVRHTLVGDVARLLLAMDDEIGLPIPTAWPRDITRKDGSSGLIAVEEYRKAGVNMLPHPAQFDDNRQHYVLPGNQHVEEKMLAGQFKVFNTPRMRAWKREWETFAYDEDGEVIKARNRQNDLMDATRYLAVAAYRGYGKRYESRRRAQPKALRIAPVSNHWN